MKKVKVDDLERGDLIVVKWLDASEIKAELPDHEQTPEIEVQDIGIFLGVAGVKKKHLLLGKDVVERFNEWGATRIPVDLIDEIVLVMPKNDVARAVSAIGMLMLTRRVKMRRYYSRGKYVRLRL